MFLLQCKNWNICQLATLSAWLNSFQRNSKIYLTMLVSYPVSYESVHWNFGCQKCSTTPLVLYSDVIMYCEGTLETFQIVQMRNRLIDGQIFACTFFKLTNLSCKKPKIGPIDAYSLLRYNGRVQSSLVSSNKILFFHVIWEGVLFFP